jgi:hypothetical protein
VIYTKFSWPLHHWVSYQIREFQCVKLMPTNLWAATCWIFNIKFVGSSVLYCPFSNRTVQGNSLKDSALNMCTHRCCSDLFLNKRKHTFSMTRNRAQTFLHYNNYISFHSLTLSASASLPHPSRIVMVSVHDTAQESVMNAHVNFLFHGVVN